MITRLTAWVRHLVARIECAFTGEHVKPRDGVEHGYRIDYCACARCGEPVAVHRGPK